MTEILTAIAVVVLASAAVGQAIVGLGILRRLDRIEQGERRIPADVMRAASSPRTGRPA